MFSSLFFRLNFAFCTIYLLIQYAIIFSVDCRLAEPTEEPSNNQIVTTTEKPLPPTTTKKPTIFTPECFHQPISICENFNTIQGGHCKKISKKTVVCCNVNSDSLTTDLMSAGVGPTAEVQSLHIINATLDVLNVSHKSWKRLISMSVTDGNIKRITGVFPKMASVSCLNLSNNGLTEIVKRSLVNLYNLTTLDLSHNNLEILPKFDTRAVNLSLDISDNKLLQCSNLLDTMESKKELIFQNPNNTYCLASKSFHWFNSTDRVPFAQMENIAELSLLCPKIGNKNCSCSRLRLDFVPGQPPTFAVYVDCSNMNLTELPKELPPYTKRLNVSYNRITSLSLLSDAKSYEDVRELYADHNEITSILKLEGTKFIDNFSRLSLRANKLKTLPTYFLSNTFDRNWTPRLVFLGQNYLPCDCNTVKVVKVWLLSKQRNIPDYDEIKCENLPQKIMDLDQTQVCQYPKDWTDYIYYIITGEVLLLVGLISKVFYDYWIFKTTGYLPWPASKMPKLPCDWLCET